MQEGSSADSNNTMTSQIGSRIEYLMQTDKIIVLLLTLWSDGKM